MTATENPADVQAPPQEASALRRLLIFGTGFGIAIHAKHLDAVLVRARPSSRTVPAWTSIQDFRSRPAADWGTELTRFLGTANEKNLAATVLLPRDEVIVRAIQLPGVAENDIPGAIELQMDSLHPYGDEEVTWASMPAGGSHYVVGLVRTTVLTAYETLFSEAGIRVSAFTFSAAAIHAALRIWNTAPASLLVFCAPEPRTEVYGESAGRPVYSAEFPAAQTRALALSRSELRLPPNYAALSLAEALPAASGPTEGISPLAYAAALAGSAPLLVSLANLLPKERRASSARRQYLLPVILGSLLLLGLVAVLVVLPALEQRSYRAALNAEIRRLEPAAQRAQALETRATVNHNRVTALDEIRRRPQADLDVLNELTRILPAQVWTSSIEIYPDSVVLSGEADQAAPLLKLLDSSPLFQNSEFALSVTRNAQNEQFRIKTKRRERNGRVTP